jgi:hypothetical protein
MISASQRSTRSQAAPQRDEQENITSKRRRVGEPEDIMDEQPDERNWFDIQLDNLEDEPTQFTNEVTTINDNDITPEPGLENLDPESPEYRKLITLKYNRQRAAPVRSSPAIMTDAPTIEDPNDEVWHETSERSDDEQPPQ